MQYGKTNIMNIKRNRKDQQYTDENYNASEKCVGGGGHLDPPSPLTKVT